MKKITAVIAIILCSVGALSARSQMSMYFYPVSDDEGKWGIQFHGEFVLMPRYDKEPRIVGEKGYFLIPRDNGKYTLASLVEGELCHDLDSAFSVGNTHLIGIVKDGRYGLLGAGEPEYDEYKGVVEWVNKSYDHFEFPIFGKQGVYSMLDADGSVICDKVKPSATSAPNGAVNKYADRIKKETGNYWRPTTEIVGRSWSLSGSKVNKLKSDFKIERANGKYYVTATEQRYMIADCDSLCDLDQVSNLAGCNYSGEKKGEFLFIKDGKRGVRTITDILVPAEYDDVEMYKYRGAGSGTLISPLFIVKKDGKYGAATINNKFWLPIEYDDLLPIPHTDKFIDSSWLNNTYFYARKGDKAQIIDRYGDVFIPEVDIKIVETNGGNRRASILALMKQYNGQIKKTQSARFDQKVANKHYNEIDDLFQQFKELDNSSKRLTEINEYFNIEIDGYRGHINDFGYIDIPVRYNAIEDNEERIGPNIFAEIMRASLNNSNIGAYEYLDLVLDLKKILEEQGVADSPLGDYVDNLIGCARSSIAYAEKKRQEAEAAQRTAEKIARLEQIGNSLTNSLYSMANTYGSIQSSTNNSNYSSGSTAKSTVNSTREKRSGSGVEASNKNTDSNTYSKCETELIKMHDFPEKYNNSERLKLQSTMRGIRIKWTNRGYRMYHSQWEDWNGL